MSLFTAKRSELADLGDSAESHLLFLEQFPICVRVDGDRRRLRVAPNRMRLYFPQFLHSLLHDESLLSHTQFIKHLAREAEHPVDVGAEVASRLHLEVVFEASLVKRLLVRHLWEDSVAQALV